jgi:hypothetical protein
MDRSTLRHKALLAAGSVVLAAGISGCPLGDDTGKAGETALADTSSEKPLCLGLDTGDNAAYLACCEQLEGWCATEFAADKEAIDECLFGPGYDGSTGCIPWGPPVPPARRLA